MRVGVVGCGYVSRQHLAALRRMSDIEIVGVCDTHRERAAELARRHGIARVFDNLEELLGATSPQVVHILTPPPTHRELALQAFQAGCNVLVEKPMATNAGEARAMVDGALRFGRSLGVCHNYLFSPAFVTARRLVAQGELGRILSADIFWRMSSGSPAVRGNAMGWMQALPGGLFQEVLPHLVYLLAALMGDLKTVAATTGRHGPGAPSELRALFEGEHGPATLALSLEARPIQKYLRLHGTRMSLHIDLATGTLIRLGGQVDGRFQRGWVNLSHAMQLLQGTLANALKLFVAQLPRGHELLIRQHYAALRAGLQPPVSGQEGLATVVVLDRLQELLGRSKQPGE